MSELQISLLALGALAVAGVYLFNLWQERRYQRRSEQTFAREHDDVLLGKEAPQAEAIRRVEPTFKNPAPTRPANDNVRREVVPGAVADPLIDFVVEVQVPSPSNGADLHQVLREVTAAWGKPLLVSGYDAAGGAWQTAGIGCNARFQQLRFALQMSNRAGCVDERQLSTFGDEVQRWAGRQQANAKSITVAEAHAMAAQLDRFCVDLDVAIGISVFAADGAPFSGTKIRALAESAGLKLESDGFFYLRGDHGEVRFTLENHEPVPFSPGEMKVLTTRGITFLLDVPRVADPPRVFDALLELARNCASTLGGSLVDDNRAVLTAESIAKIRRQIEGISGKMDAAQISAGGTRALRLFS
jgi:FtsZ-interacting cell division protein ZipA